MTDARMEERWCPHCRKLQEMETGHSTRCPACGKTFTRQDESFALYHHMWTKSAAPEGHHERLWSRLWHRLGRLFRV